MIGTYEINQAKNTLELGELIEKAAFERNCEIDSSMSFKESAEFLREEAEKDQGNGADKIVELADLLDSAESKWFELED